MAAPEIADLLRRVREATSSCVGPDPEDVALLDALLTSLENGK